MITDPRYNEELNIDREDNWYGAQDFVKKYLGDDLENDYNGEVAFLRGLADTLYAADMDEAEFLRRSKVLDYDRDDETFIGICSAMRFLKLYYLKDENGKVPVSAIDDGWIARECFDIFTGEDKIPKDMAEKYSVHKAGIIQIIRMLETHTKMYNSVAINDGGDMVLMTAQDFRQHVMYASWSDMAIDSALTKGVDGDCLFPIIAAYFTGHNVACRLSDGSSVEGTATAIRTEDDEDEECLIEITSGGCTSSIPLADIAFIAITEEDQGSAAKPGSKRRRRQQS